MLITPRLSIIIKITIYSTVKDSKEALNDERLFDSRIIPSLGNIKLAKLTSLYMENYVNPLRNGG